MASELNSDIDTALNPVVKTATDKAFKAVVQEITQTEMRLRNISASQRNKKQVIKKQVSQVVVRNLEQKEHMNKIEEEMNMEKEMGSDEEPQTKSLAMGGLG